MLSNEEITEREYFQKSICSSLSKNLNIKEEDLMEYLVLPNIGNNILKKNNKNGENGTEESQTVVEYPDFCLNVLALKRLQSKYKEFKIENAEEFTKSLVGSLEKNQDLDKVNSTGTFINFYVNKKTLLQKVLGKVFDEKEKYGNSTVGKGKKSIVEYSSPNIAKPFHAGHLRSTIIGNFLKHLHRAMGYEVIAINYLGDWGKQYGLLALGFSKYGDEEKLKTNPIKHLYDVYVSINKDAEQDNQIHEEARSYFRKMEQGDSKCLELWQRFRDMSIEEYKHIYKRLNIEFDVYSGESQFSEGMKIELNKMHEKKLLVKSENGAYLSDLNEYNLGTTVVQKKDGTTLYITRDIAAAVDRKNKYEFDQMYYVVAAAQDLHFKQLFKILDLMDYEWSKKCTHINFGMVQGMSTRKGTVVFLQDILDCAKEHVFEIMQQNEEKFSKIQNPEQIADIIGVSAVIIQDLSARRIKDYKFELERVTKFEGLTGPYLQYAHARLCSIERKSKVEDLQVKKDINYDLLIEPEIVNLVKQISLFQSTLLSALKTSEPQVVVQYLFELAKLISVCHKSIRVVGLNNKELAKARLLMFWSAKTVLNSGLKILGIIPVEMM